MTSSPSARLGSLVVSPPLVNSSSPWCSDLDQLADLCRSPSTGAVTTRTATLRGFAHDPKQHGVRPFLSFPRGPVTHPFLSSTPFSERRDSRRSTRTATRLTRSPSTSPPSGRSSSPTGRAISPSSSVRFVPSLSLPSTSFSLLALSRCVSFWLLGPFLVCQLLQEETAWEPAGLPFANKAEADKDPFFALEPLFLSTPLPPKCTLPKPSPRRTRSNSGT